MPIGLGSSKMALYSRIFRRNLEKIPEESDLPHTYKCECDSHWVENGLNPRPCWACGTLVTPKCLHI